MSKAIECFTQMLHGSDVANLEQMLNSIILKNWLPWFIDGSIHLTPPQLKNSLITLEATLTINYNLSKIPSSFFVPKAKIIYSDFSAKDLIHIC